jgi:hypothetical protein
MGRIIATQEDIELSIKLLFETIMLKIDELDGSLRQFFEQLKDYVKGQPEEEKHCFSRREVRQALNISKTQQHRFLNQLLSLEYVKQVGGQGNSRHRYQVVYWDDNEKLRKAIQQQLNEQLSLL